MIEWEDASSWSKSDADRSEPKTWRLKITRDISIVVTRNIYHKPDAWVMHCRPLFDEHPLDSKNVDEAKVQAVALVTIQLDQALKKLRQIS